MTLEELLAPLNEREFRSEWYEKRALHIRGEADKYAHLFSYGELNRVLNSGSTPLPTLKVAREGRPVIVTDEIGLLDAVQGGATVIIDRIDEYSPPLRKAVSGWSKSLNEPLQINLYLSQPDRQGFVTHYDTHDVLILQINGFKRWRVFEPTLRFPLWVQKEHSRKINGAPYLETVVAPGDLLYVPRGHWHDATACSGPSMHLTLGINSRTGIDYLNWLSNELRSREAWRRDLMLAVDPGSEEDSDARMVELKHDLLRLFDASESVAAYRSYCAASAKKSFSFDFPNQLGNVATLANLDFSASEEQQASVQRDDDDRVLRVAVQDRLYTLSQDSEHVVKAMLSGRRFSRDDLVTGSPSLSAELIDDLLRRFLADGVINAD